MQLTKNITVTAPVADLEYAVATAINSEGSLSDVEAEIDITGYDLDELVSQADDVEIHTLKNALIDRNEWPEDQPEMDAFGIIETGKEIHLVIPGSCIGDVLAARNPRELIVRVGLEQAAPLLETSSIFQL